MKTRVAITGLGVVHPGLVGGRHDLERYLGAPFPTVRPGGDVPLARLEASVLAAQADATEARRLSRACQLTIAAARLALADAGLDGADRLGLVVGTEFGDLRSTAEFVDGYLRRGPAGLSPLLFPNTVMNTMAATTAIAVAARELTLTLNAPMLAGELAVARAAAAIAAGRAECLLAGGVDEMAPVVAEQLAALGALDPRAEGAAFVVLEAWERARARGAAIVGEVAGAAWRALPARPHGVGRATGSRAIAAALAGAGVAPRTVGCVYTSASGDAARDAWEQALLAAALGPGDRPEVALAPLLGVHAGLGPLKVAACARTARTGTGPRLAAIAPGPGLVHAVARGGTHVALVVDAGARG